MASRTTGSNLSTPRGWAADPGVIETLISADRLRHRVADLGKEISRDYGESELVMVGVLKGAIIFFADLIRSVTCPIEIDFMAVSSYGEQTTSSGVVRIVKDLEVSIEDRDVLIVEDIVDSGITLQSLKQHLDPRGAKSIEACALLVKSGDLREDYDLRYTGFQVPDRFIVGYGLDHAQRFRNLDFVAALDGP